MADSARRCALVIGLVLLGLPLWPRLSSAGNLGPVNLFAQGQSLGGAGYAGLASPASIHYNPAGLDLTAGAAFLLEEELAFSSASYRPLWPDRAEAKAHIPVAGAPSFGASWRLSSNSSSAFSDIVLGLAFYGSHDGTLEYAADEVQTGILKSSIRLWELTPAVSYQVTSQLSFGAGLRVGFATMELVNNDWNYNLTAPYEMSGRGTGLGATFGAMFTPSSWLRFGAVYSTELKVSAQGTGRTKLDLQNWTDNTFSVDLPFPQWAALGLALTPHRSVEVQAGVRWTNWSSFEEMCVSNMLLNPKWQYFKNCPRSLNYTDGFSVHLGTQWRPGWSLRPFHRVLALRGGVAFDSSVVPDSSMQRDQFDVNKLTIGAGLSVALWQRLALDLVGEGTIGLEREVPDSIFLWQSPIHPPHWDRHNPHPGSYSFRRIGVSLALSYYL